MGQAHSFGRMFVTVANQASGAPLGDRCSTIEQESPWRTGDGYLIRTPFTKGPSRGIVFGLWRKPPTGAPVGPSHG